MFVPSLPLFHMGHYKKYTPCLGIAHFLYRMLDSKKTSLFQFSFPSLREIHRNLKQQKNFNCHDGFFRKSSFCTFSCINPGFDGPLDKLGIFFYCHFYNASKECFWPKKIIKGFKMCHFGKIEKLPKM